MNHFLQHFEKFLHFINSFQYETNIFGDFDINTLIDKTDSTRYGNLLVAFGCKIRNFSTTRVTPTSKSCRDNVITQNPVLTDTIKATISDHYTTTSDVVLKQIGQGVENQTTLLAVRNLNNLKNERAVNFFVFFEP